MKQNNLPYKRIPEVARMTLLADYEREKIPILSEATLQYLHELKDGKISMEVKSEPEEALIVELNEEYVTIKEELVG